MSGTSLDAAPPVPVVSDAAVEAAARAMAGVVSVGKDYWRATARLALGAALPHLAAVPSATREELSALLLTFLRPPKHGGSWTYSPDEAADALVARFTITPKED